jgi:hypothetical protein
VTYDVSTPSQPDRLSTLPIAGGAIDVALRGNFALVAADVHGLRVIDVNDPAHPAETGSYVPASTAVRGVDASGTKAYVSTQPGGLRVVDVADPTAPAPLGFVPLAGSPQGITVQGTRAFVAAGHSGLQIVDVSNASAPSLLGTSVPGHELAVDVAVDGNLAFVGGRTYYNDATEREVRGNLRVVDVSDAAHPLTLATLRGDFIGVTAQPGLAFAASRFDDDSRTVSKLEVFDVTTPATPQRLAAVALAAQMRGPLVASGHSLFTIDQVLRKFDLSHPARPKQAWSLALDTGTGQALHGLAVAGGYAYVGGGDGGLNVVDLSAPARVGILHGDAYVVAVDGARAYVGGRTGLRIVDISDPAHPVKLGAIHGPWSASELRADGNRLYVAPYPGKSLLIYDVSDPANPQLGGSYDNSHESTSMQVAGTIAYLGDGLFGRIDVIDVTDAAAPALLGHLNLTPGALSDLALDGNSLYASLPAIPGGGMRRIDLSDPAHPAIAGEYFMNKEFAEGVAVLPSGTIALVASDGLRTLLPAAAGLQTRR